LGGNFNGAVATLLTGVATGDGGGGG